VLAYSQLKGERIQCLVQWNVTGQAKANNSIQKIRKALIRSNLSAQQCSSPHWPARFRCSTNYSEVIKHLPYSLDKWTYDSFLSGYQQKMSKRQIFYKWQISENGVRLLEGTKQRFSFYGHRLSWTRGPSAPQKKGIMQKNCTICFNFTVCNNDFLSLYPYLLTHHHSVETVYSHTQKRHL